MKLASGDLLDYWIDGHKSFHQGSAMIVSAKPNNVASPQRPRPAAGMLPALARSLPSGAQDGDLQLWVSVDLGLGEPVRSPIACAEQFGLVDVVRRIRVRRLGVGQQRAALWTAPPQLDGHDEAGAETGAEADIRIVPLLPNACGSTTSKQPSPPAQPGIETPP